MWRALAFALVVATAAPAFADGYQAVCAPMRTGPPKKPHAEWRGPCRHKVDDAKRDADEHNRRFPEHGARVMMVKDGCGEEPGADRGRPFVAAFPRAANRTHGWSAMDYPNDADGDALRRVASHSDMSKPMEIDFAVDVPNERAGKEVARLAAEHGYATKVDFDKEDRRWTCYCTKRMVATHAAVIAAQKELDSLSAAVGGKSDGWGTFGNGS